VTIVAVENQYYTIRVCVCSLRYPAFNVYALYFHLWSVRLYNIFICDLSGCTIFSFVVCPAVQYFQLWSVRLYNIFSCGLSGCTIFSVVVCPAVQYFQLWSVRLYNIFSCGLSGCTIFFLLMTLRARFSDKSRDWHEIRQEMLWLISSEYFCFHPAFTHYLALCCRIRRTP
jgi:hypothetical protein